MKINKSKSKRMNKHNSSIQIQQAGFHRQDVKRQFISFLYLGLFQVRTVDIVSKPKKKITSQFGTIPQIRRAVLIRISRPGIPELFFPESFFPSYFS